MGGREGGQEGGGIATGRWRQGGGIWKGAMEMWRSNRDGMRVAMGRGTNVRRRNNGRGGGRWEGGNGEGGKMKEVGMGRGRIRGKRRGDFTDGCDGMPAWT